MQITYRKADLSDCQKIAELMHLASGGIIDFLYQGLFSDLDPVDFVANNLKIGKYPYNYDSAIVADADGSVVGISYSYPSRYHGLSESSRYLLPRDRIEHLDDFFNSKVDNSWFLDSFGVDPDWQNYGIGSKLLKLTEERALSYRYNSLSLFVFADNIDAIRLYSKKGFIVEKRVVVKPHERIPHSGGCLLMKKDLIIKL